MSRSRPPVSDQHVIFFMFNGTKNLKQPANDFWTTKIRFLEIKIFGVSNLHQKCQICQKSEILKIQN